MGQAMFISRKQKENHTKITSMGEGVGSLKKKTRAGDTINGASITSGVRTARAKLMEDDVVENTGVMVDV